MSIIVRDEADIIAHNIEYHRRMGVDRFIVIDHRSVDGTSRILEHFRDQGILDIIPKRREVYKKAVWTNGLVKTALQRYGHTWHIGNDADEFYVPPAGHTLKSYLATHGEDRAIVVPRQNVIFSQEAQVADGWHRAPGYVMAIKKKEAVEAADPGFTLEHPQVYYYVNSKMVFQPSTFGFTTIGFHAVYLRPRVKAVGCGLRILHFPVRKRDEAIRSAIRLGRSAVMLEPTKTTSLRYRRWFNMSEAGVPEQEIYDEMLPTEARLQSDVAAGLLVPVEYPAELRQVLAMTAEEITPTSEVAPGQE
jgi:Glycosyl transferase family 2